MTTPISNEEFHKGQTIRIVVQFVDQDDDALDPDVQTCHVIKPDGSEVEVTLEQIMNGGEPVVGSYEGFFDVDQAGRYLVRGAGTVSATNRNAVQIGELYVQRDPFVAA